MKEANDFFRRFKEKTVGGLNTCAIGEIVSYDPIKSKADVNLLPGDTLIKSVPVGIQQTADFFIRIPYKRGDTVLVVFVQREIDNIMYQSNNPASQRMLAVDDAVVVCGINLFTNNLPAADTDKLLIGEKLGGATISIGGGKISMTGIVEVNGSQIG
ncbi:Gp138 family membrane-puncturing spike protein [Bacillus hominis]|uniref:Gp138 family membrane-puncturing spike protein n=1 Tax=Bacillus hominis TaxID=2817478 RepID=UPI001BB34BDC|nr:Gp138 family membrane-puncturing spike protein [Bacillus hominis]